MNTYILYIMHVLMQIIDELLQSWSLGDSSSGTAVIGKYDFSFFANS